MWDVRSQEIGSGVNLKNERFRVKVCHASRSHGKSRESEVLDAKATKCSDKSEDSGIAETEKF